MRAVIAMTLAACLVGCVPTSIIRDRAIEQNVTIEDVTDTILVANILRARDQAPLQFADIPLMHESFQVSGGLTPTFLFGPAHAGSPSDTVAPTVTVQEAPTFDLSNLDTQEFVTGIMSPVKAGVVKYWLDRGLDDRIALLLFFSSVTVTVGKGDTAQSLTIRNDPRGVAENPDQARKSGGFLAYLSLIDSIKGKFKVVEAPDLTPVGPPFTLAMNKHLKELSKVDTSKYELDPLEPNPDAAARRTQPYTAVEEPVEGKIYPQYQLFSVSDKKVLICFNTPRASARSPAEQKLCKEAGGALARRVTPKPSLPCKSPEDFVKSDCSATLKFAIRSAGDVVHFLGNLVYLQENNPLPKNELHNPITLKYCARETADCSEGGALFNIVRERQASPGRLRVPYRGDYYTVPNATPADHTLEVMAITAQLINLNKSAKELRSTPTVQIVP
jgi:hypothetical protein